MRDEVEVAVVGGGAAGIAATRRLADRGRSVLLIEALPRLGGRALTRMVDGLPLDLGCGWLHSADRNPLVGMAEAAGLTVDRRQAAWGRQLRDLGFPPAAQAASWSAYAAFEQRLRDDPPPSDRAGDAMPADAPWRPFADALSGYLNGAELDRLSAADFLAYEDAATACNWRLPAGYGVLMATLGAALPTALGTTVTAIDRTGKHLRIDTDRGTLRADAAIVAIPTDRLAAGAIRFTPPLDDHLHAAAALPLGLADKLFLALPDAALVPPETHLIGDPHDAATGSYYLRPFGRPVVECFFGGMGARQLEQEGPEAAFRFAAAQLGALLGQRFAGGLRPIAGSAWGRAPTIGGSYSHALPGRAGARAILAKAPERRLCFAGEACSPHAFSTAHGAWESGIAAASHVDAALEVC